MNVFMIIGSILVGLIILLIDTSVKEHKHKPGNYSPVIIPEYTENEYRQHEIYIAQIETMDNDIKTLYNKAQSLRKEAIRVIQSDKNGKHITYKYSDIKRYTMLDNALKCELKAYDLIIKRDKLKDKLYISFN